MLPLDANINPGCLGPGVCRWEEGCQGAQAQGVHGGQDQGDEGEKLEDGRRRRSVRSQRGANQNQELLL